MTSQIDPAYDMPVRNWQQGGSFPTPLTLLLEDPDSSPLVQLPCINQSYVLALMGCLDQLRNPATWDPASSPASIDAMLSRITKLQEMMWGAMDVPCCHVTLRLTDTCVLQYSTDGGDTWVDVTDWSTNFPNCVTNQIVAPVPPNPGPALPNQHACNIAGFLASEIIEKAMQVASADIGASKNDVQYAVDILAEISFAFPITYAASVAFHDWYNGLVAELLSEVTTASTDPVLWSRVTCAIYEAIKTTGYVTSSNFASIVANLAAISYTYAWAPGLIAGFVNNLGLVNVRAMQNVGALDDVDCTDCGTWCYQFDFTVGTQGWVPIDDGYANPSAQWQSGVGWKTVSASFGRDLFVQLTLPTPMTIIHGDITFTCDAADATPGHRRYYFLSSGTVVAQYDIDPSANTAPHHSSTGAISVFCDTVWIVLRSPSGEIILSNAQLSGNGPDPFGVDNCTY